MQMSLCFAWCIYPYTHRVPSILLPNAVHTRPRRCFYFNTTLQYHTPLAVGTLLGLTTMMSQFMFVLFAVFLALAEYADEPGLATGDRTMAVFSFFLFLLYVSSAGVGCCVYCCWSCGEQCWCVMNEIVFWYWW